MSNPANPGRRNSNNNGGGSRRPVKWTYLELGGLALAFFLIIWPVMTLVMDTISPHSTARAGANLTITKTSNKAPSNNALPGDTVIYTITAKSTAPTTDILGLSDTVPNPGAGVWNGVCTAVATSNVAGNTPAAPTTPDGYAFSLTTGIDPNETITIIITCQLKATAAPVTITNIVTGNLSLNQDAPTPSASVPLTIMTGITPTATNTPTATATNTPTSTNTPTVTNTPKPTNTTGPATNTPVPAAPTNTPVPGGGGGGGGGGSPTNTSVPGNITVNPATITAVIGGLLSATPGTPLGAGATPPPPASTTAQPAQPGNPATATSTSQPAAIPPQVSGVISGAFSSSTGSLAGNQVSLILRTSGGADQTVKTTIIDSSNHYFFSGVPSTSAGQVYFVRFSNPDPGSGVLRLFNTNAFSFAGGNYRVSAADISDVRTGPPGTGNNSFQLPITLSWFSRSSEDRYSVSVFKANSNGPTLDSGLLGNATNFTVQNGQLTEGSYFAQINVLNPLGTGISNRQFAFRIVPGIILAPTVTRIAAAQPAATTAAPSATTAAPTKAVANATATTPAISGAQQVPATTPSPAPTSGTGSTLPSGSNQLPGTGGELPIVGLLLAGFTLVMRRFRLVQQER